MTETDTGYVYTLSDPRTGDPAYVGATTQPDRRYRAHLTNPHSDGLAEWIAELEAEGLAPEMSLVRVTGADDLRNEERKVLARIADEFDLLNADMFPGYSGRGADSHPLRLLDPPRFGTLKSGYEEWSDSLRGDRTRVRVHRLLAVAEYGFDAVRGMVVHHGSESHLPEAEIPWANWGGNIELMTNRDHTKHHLSPGGLSWLEKLRTSEMYRNGEVYQRRLAEEFDVSQDSVSRAVRELGCGGKKHGKLTEEEVVEIDERLRGGEPHKEIAKDYGVHAATVGRISRGGSWGGVTGR